jgi:hypothetical protein
MSKAKRATVRAVVPILGTGFNRWLIGSAPASPTLTGWTALLRHLAWSKGLLPDPKLEAKLALKEDQPFVWESLILAAVARDYAASRGNRDQTAIASTHEGRLLAELSRLFGSEVERLARDHEVRRRVARFEAALLGPLAQADVLSLNVDGLFEAALETSRVRTWYPHGRVGSKTLEPVFGYMRYAMNVERITGSFKAFKSNDSRRTAPANVREANAHRVDLDPSANHWVPVAINAPLLLLGVGFDRSEIDLWHFLHLRARNHARVAPEQRPRIFRLTCDAENAAERAHWDALSDGLTIHALNLGATWDEAWESLLGLLPTAESFDPPHASAR